MTTAENILLCAFTYNNALRSANTSSVAIEEDYASESTEFFFEDGSSIVLCATDKSGIAFRSNPNLGRIILYTRNFHYNY